MLGRNDGGDLRMWRTLCITIRDDGGISDEELEDMMTEADTNGDGKIDFHGECGLLWAAAGRSAVLV
jgi:Ca2+-binding EF-hand superfamily protein